MVAVRVAGDVDGCFLLGSGCRRSGHSFETIENQFCWAGRSQRRQTWKPRSPIGRIVPWLRETTESSAERGHGRFSAHSAGSSSAGQFAPPAPDPDADPQQPERNHNGLRLLLPSSDRQVPEAEGSLAVLQELRKDGCSRLAVRSQSGRQDLRHWFGVEPRRFGARLARFVRSLPRLHGSAVLLPGRVGLRQETHGPRLVRSRWSRQGVRLWPVPSGRAVKDLRHSGSPRWQHARVVQTSPGERHLHGTVVVRGRPNYEPIWQNDATHNKVSYCASGPLWASARFKKEIRVTHHLFLFNVQFPGAHRSQLHVQEAGGVQKRCPQR